MTEWVCFFAFTLISCDYIYYRDAHRLAEKGYFDIARKKYEEKLSEEKNPEKRAVLHARIAEVFEKEKKPAKAINHYKSAIKYGSKDIGVFRGLGRLYLQVKKCNEVISLFKKLRKEENFHSYQGDFHLFSGRAYLCLRLFSKAETEFRVLTDGKFSKKVRAQAFYHLGEANVILGFGENAVKQFRNAIDLDPENAEPYIALGLEYAKRKNYREAKIYFNRSIVLEQDKPEVYFNLGQIYEIEGDLDKAVVSYSKSLQLDGELIEIHLRLALIYIEKKNFSFARYHLNKIQNTNADFANIEKYHGKIFLLENNYTEAINYFLRSLSSFPRDEESLYFLAIAYGNDGNSTKALFYMKKLEKLNAGYRDLFAKIGDLYLILGQEKKARAYYMKELKRNERSPLASVGLARIEANSSKPRPRRIADLLKKAFESGYSDREGLKKSPYFSKVINHREIAELLNMK